MKIILLSTIAFIIKTEILTFAINDMIQQYRDTFCGGCLPNLQACNNNEWLIGNTSRAGNFTYQNILNNKYGITKINGTTIHLDKPVKFYFQGTKYIETKPSYTIYIPVDPNSTINGVVVYFHPTIFGNWNQPSDQKIYYRNLGIFYASQNYIVVFPHQMGFNGDGLPHPYVLYPYQTVGYANHCLNHAYDQIKNNPHISTQINLFSTGYSQGAAYSIWMMFCKQYSFVCNQQSLRLEYTYLKAAGMDGAYDLRIVQDFLLLNVSTDNQVNYYKIQNNAITGLGKPGLSALTMDSYTYYTLGSKDFFQKYTNSTFFNMPNINFDGVHYNLGQVLNKINADSGQISLKIYQSAIKTQYSLTNNSIYSLYDNTVLKDSKFNTTIEAASIAPRANTFTKPIYLFTLANDSLVSPRNTMSFLNKASGSSYVTSDTFQNNLFKTCRQIKPVSVDHIGAEYMANTFVLNFFNS